MKFENVFLPTKPRFKIEEVVKEIFSITRTNRPKEWYTTFYINEIKKIINI